MPWQDARGAIWQAVLPECLGEWTDPRGQFTAWARDHGNGDQARECFPVFPMVKAHQTVTAHNPGQLGVRTVFAEKAHQVDCVADVQLMFDIADLESAIVPGQYPNRPEPGFIVTWRFLERVARRREPPDLIQIQAPHGGLCDMQVTRMRRVEASPKQADTRARASRRQVRSWAKVGHIRYEPLGSGLSRAANLILEYGELFCAHRSACVNAAGRDSDLCTHAELSAISELG